MQSGRKYASVWGTVALLLYFAPAGPAQDLGEVARKQKAKQSATPAAERRVLTNEDIHSPSTVPADSGSPPKETADRGRSAAKSPDSRSETKEEKKPSAEEVKQAIGVQKKLVASLEARLKSLQQEVDKWAYRDCSALFHRENPSQNACDVQPKLIVERNRVQGELERERKTLEEMQEAARRMGYGNSVYEPD